MTNGSPCFTRRLGKNEIMKFIIFDFNVGKFTAT